MQLIDLVSIAKTLNDKGLKGKEREIYLKDNYNISERTWQKKIKDTPIVYNNKTKQYDIPNIESLESNDIDTLKKQNNNSKVTQNNYKSNTGKTTKSYEGVSENSYKLVPEEIHNSDYSVAKETIGITNEIVEVGYKEIAPKEEFENMKGDIEYIKEQLNILFEKIKLKEEREKNIIQLPKIDLEQYELKGEVDSRSFKTYKHVLDKFKEFCKKRNETQKDLLAVALLEFMNKYGR